MAWGIRKGYLDANTYLLMTKALDYFDPARDLDGNLNRAFAAAQAKFLVVSFSSDWLYPPEGCKELALALTQVNKPVTYLNVPSPYGHDSFLVETDKVGRLLRSFLAH